MKRLILCAGLFCAVAGVLQAGEIIKEPAENTPVEKEGIFSYNSPQMNKPDEKRWFFSLSGWYERKTGNTNTLKVNSQGELLYSDNITEVRLFGRFFYGENSYSVVEDKADGTLRYDRYVFPRIELFVFTQSEYNNPARLAYRNNSGAGAKFVFFKNAFWKMDISGAPVYQYEDYETRDRTEQMRWSVRYRVRINPLEFVVYDFVCFYIPRVDDGSAYRFNLETSLKIKLNSRLAFTAGFIHLYNRNAFPGTQRVDDNFYTQLSLAI